jgi:hypothetical protein
LKWFLIFTIRKIRNKEEFDVELDTWKLDDGLIDQEWVEANSRTKSEYGDDYECWREISG